MTVPASPPRRRWQALRVLALSAAVAVAHLALWDGIAREHRPPPRRLAAVVPVVQVRTIAVDAQVHATPQQSPRVPVAAVPTSAGVLASDVGARAARRGARAAARAEGAVRDDSQSQPMHIEASSGAAAPPSHIDSESTVASMAAENAVVQPTRVPAPALLNYTLSRGANSGHAQLSWQVDAERYVLQLQAQAPLGRETEQRSTGGFDATGLAPLRLADRRRGRDLRAANFQREHGKVTFSGPTWEWPLQAGMQDRLSWIVQLVSISAGAPAGLREGSQVSMWVVGARGAISDWRFEVRGRARVAAPDGEADALWLVREPAHPYDLRIEVWLDPSRGHWPLRLRQTQVPGGDPLEWTLREEPSAPGT